MKKNYYCGTFNQIPPKKNGSFIKKSNEEDKEVVEE